MRSVSRPNFPAVAGPLSSERSITQQLPSTCVKKGLDRAFDACSLRRKRPRFGETPSGGLGFFGGRREALQSDFAKELEEVGANSARGRFDHLVAD